MQKNISRELCQREPSVWLGLSVLDPIGSTVDLDLLCFFACRSTAGPPLGVWPQPQLKPSGSWPFIVLRQALTVPWWPWTQYVVEDDFELPIFMPSFPKCRELQDCVTTPSLHGAGNWTQGLVYVKHVLYQLSYITSPRSFGRNISLWWVSITFFHSVQDPFID